MSVKLGLIGGGIMGEALLSRLIAQKIYQPSEVIVSEPQQQRRNSLEQQYGVAVTADNRVVALDASVLLLAVKPQVFEAIAADLADVVTGLTRDSPPLVISILAGVPLSQLEAAFPQLPVIRAMPNTPATVGAGITAISSGSHTRDRHQKNSAATVLGGGGSGGSTRNADGCGDRAIGVGTSLCSDDGRSAV